MTDEHTPDETATDEHAPEAVLEVQETTTDVVEADQSTPNDETDVQSADTHAPDTQSDTSKLEEEGDVAADYLEELLDILDLDGDIDIDVENGRASVSVGDSSSARALRRLIGSDGEVLDALQELTRLAVQTKTGERTRLMLDVGGFRSGRRRELESQAAESVEQVRTSGEPVTLEPMTPFERKVVHDVVADAGLRSESEGEGTNRRVVIHPAS